MDNEWKFEKFNDGSFKSAEDNVKKKYEQFLTDFNNHVSEQIEVQEGFGTSNVDIYFDPIKLNNDSYESTSYLQLVSSDNKILNKVVIVFATLCSETEYLRKEANEKFIPALSFYGECKETKEDDTLYVPLMMGRFLPTLQNIMNFVNRVNDVIKNIVQQLAGLYTKSSDSSYLSDITNLYFEDIYKAMSNLFYILISLDSIFSNHGAFLDDWEAYKRILTTAKQDPEKYGLDKDKVQPFETLLMNLEGKLMQGQIFINCCIQNFDDSNSQISITNNTNFAFILNKALKHRLSFISNKLLDYSSSSSVGDDSLEKDEFVGWCGLYGLYVTLYGNADRKLFKELDNIQNKIPAIPLPGNRVWYPLQFLRISLPFLTKSLDSSRQIEQAKQKQRSYLQEKSGHNFSKELRTVYATKLLQWCMRVNQEFRRTSDTIAHPGVRATLLIEGYHLASKIKQMCKTVLQLHTDMGQGMTKSTSIDLCHGMELCKLVESTIHFNSLLVSEYLGIITTDCAHKIISIVENMKVHIKAQVDKSFSRRQLDILSSLSLMVNILNGCSTKQRILVTKILLSIIRPEDILKDDVLTELKHELYNYSILSNYYENIRDACDCTFFYWARTSVFPSYLDSIYKNCESIGRLQYSLSALTDCCRSLLSSTHNSSTSITLSNYEANIIELLKTHLLNPISEAVEVDLRVQFYSHVLGRRQQINPFTGGGDIVSQAGMAQLVNQTDSMNSSGDGGSQKKKPGPTNANLLHFIKAKPIRFFDRHIRIKDFVELHLESVFHNLTAIYPSDWRTYSEMRQLGQHRFGVCISVPDMHLPNHSLEQGRDVLNIMRSMAQFTAVYVYNLNTQVFVEKKSDSKFLNTVNIRHVGNSIRTHGTGIINTTINNAYVFLKSKFFQFSEFLYDERIKGKLIKELHEHRERCAESNQPFPFQNAERVRTAIRKMFIYEDGTNPLDRFRNHVTRMGNAMGFVRSIRSGALHCGSASSNFLPPTEDELFIHKYTQNIINKAAATNSVGGGSDSDKDGGMLFEKSARLAELSDETLHAAKNLDVVLSNMGKYFVRDTDYFKMFVDIFAPEFRDKKNIHCHNFYMLLPALTLSFVDHIMECKEKLNRKNKDVFIFSDDGFSIGVAFILKVLDLYKEFDSLQWFKAIYKYYDTKQIELKKNLASTSKSDENLRQTQTLSLKRLEQRKSEFQLLEYSINSARIFFRADLTAAEEKESADKKKMEIAGTVEA